MSLCCSPLRKKVLRAILIDRALEFGGQLDRELLFGPAPRRINEWDLAWQR